MRKRGGQAEGCARPAGARNVPGIRQHHAEAEAREEGGVEREVRVGQEGSHQAHCPPVLARAEPGLGRRMLEQQALPLRHAVERAGVDFAPKEQVCVAVASAAERVDLAADADAADPAPAVAAVPASGASEMAIQDSLAPGELGQVERAGAVRLAFEQAPGFQGNAECARQPGLRRHHDGRAQYRRHGGRNGAVVTDSALHEYPFAGRPRALDAIEIIEAYGIHEARQQVVAPHALLCCALDVARNEGSALVVEIRRRKAGKGQFANLFGRDIERFPGRFFQERSGPGAARLVHGIVRGHAGGQVRVLCVLSAYFENSVDIRIEMRRGRGVGHDLVDDARRQRMQRGKLAAGAGHAQPRDADRHGRKPRQQSGIAAPGRLHGIAVGAQIFGGNHG